MCMLLCTDLLERPVLDTGYMNTPPAENNHQSFQVPGSCFPVTERAICSLFMWPSTGAALPS